MRSYEVHRQFTGVPLEVVVVVVVVVVVGVAVVKSLCYS